MSLDATQIDPVTPTKVEVRGDEVGESGLLPFRLPCLSFAKTSDVMSVPGVGSLGIAKVHTDQPALAEIELPVPLQVPFHDPMSVSHALVVPQNDGGLPCFKKRKADVLEEPPEMVTPILTAEPKTPEGLTQEIAAHLEAVACEPHDAGASEPDLDPVPLQTHFVQVIRHPDDMPQMVLVDVNATVGSMTVAEDQLKVMKSPVQILTPVGTAVPLASTTTPFQKVFLRDMHTYGTADPRFEAAHPMLSSDQEWPRIQVLRRQFAWVAMDEMTHYLSMIEATGQAGKAAPCHVPASSCDDDINRILSHWFDKVIEACQDVPLVVSAMLIHQHWLPVVVHQGVGTVKVCTTPDAKDWIDAATQHLPKMPPVRLHNMYTAFPNDCGFQCVSWMIHVVMQNADGIHKPFTGEDATVWRDLFEHHLFVSGTALTLIQPSCNPCGGTAAGDVGNQLQQLLVAHGVPSSQTQARADVILTKLTRSQIVTVLRSASPWRDLKALANQCTPKLQLVLASEMQAAIEKRLSDPTPLGNRRKKAPKVERGKLQLQPDDISIPDGVFKAGESSPVQQIGVTHVGPSAQGVVVALSHQILPYLRANKPVSANGLAFLILDHAAVALHGLGETIRFPAHCHHTGEPILLTARLIQVGSVHVSRVVASQMPKVEEVTNSVIKVMVYQDEMQQWDEFQRHPVTWLIQQFPMLATTSADAPVVIDCWDGQTLNAKLERTRADRASIYAVSLRIANVNAADVLKQSGHGAVYFEPRSDDGRSHDTRYRVIWLGKMDKTNAMLAVQSTNSWACLVRSAHRFGIRVLAQDAHQVHLQHRPQLPYLDNSQLTTYVAGPFPFGATRQSLAKIFTTWHWPARPTQPKGRNGDGTGILWEVHASAPPAFNVYQLEHADVLITEQQKRSRPAAASRLNIQGSAKTIAALTKLPQGDSAAEATLQFGGTDPWAGWNPNKSAKVDGKDGGSYVPADIIAKQVETKVMRVLEDKLADRPGDDDAPMRNAHEDTRIADLEAKLQQLECTVERNQITQERNHLEVTGQVATLHTQVEAQSSQLQKHFDARMAEQLAQIERLLSKRKGPEWLSQRTLRFVGLALLLITPFAQLLYGSHALPLLAVWCFFSVLFCIVASPRTRECGLLPFRLPSPMLQTHAVPKSQLIPHLCRPQSPSTAQSRSHQWLFIFMVFWCVLVATCHSPGIWTHDHVAVQHMYHFAFQGMRATPFQIALQFGCSNPESFMDSAWPTTWWSFASGTTWHTHCRYL